MTQPRLYVAFDFDNLEQARTLLAQLPQQGCGVKVGKEMFTAFGPAWVKEVVDAGFPVFLDAKYHDIPNTVAGAVRAAAKMGVRLINVHASGGSAMMEAAKEATLTVPQPPALIAVTILTSMVAQDLQAIGMSDDMPTQVMRLAQLTQAAGLDGVVCPALEAQALRQSMGDNFLLVTPGIRMAADDKGDQRRVLTPRAAVEAGSDVLVVGRAITNADCPKTAFANIVANMDEAKR